MFLATHQLSSLLSQFSLSLLLFLVMLYLCCVNQRTSSNPLLLMKRTQKRGWSMETGRRTTINQKKKEKQIMTAGKSETRYHKLVFLLHLSFLSLALTSFILLYVVCCFSSSSPLFIPSPSLVIVEYSFLCFSVHIYIVDCIPFLSLRFFPIFLALDPIPAHFDAPTHQMTR